MNLGEFREALRDWSDLDARGISDEQADFAIRQAYATVVAAADWPWLRVRVTGLTAAALAEFKGLRTVDEIADTGAREGYRVLRQVTVAEGRRLTGDEPQAWSRGGAVSLGQAVNVWPEPADRSQARFEAAGPINGGSWPPAGAAGSSEPTVTGSGAGAPSVVVPDLLHPAMTAFAVYEIALAQGDARIARAQQISGQDKLRTAIARFGGAEPGDTAYGSDAAVTVVVNQPGVVFGDLI